MTYLDPITNEQAEQTVFAEKHHCSCGAERFWDELDFVGVQTFDDGGPDLALFNCPSCHTTVSKELP